MFEIGTLQKLSNIKTEICTLDVWVKNYKQNLNYFDTCLDFCVSGNLDQDKYSICFKLYKPTKSLLDIELNTCRPIQEYIDTEDVQFEVNGVFGFYSIIKGEIYRIINKTIVIKMVFLSEHDNYVGTIEIEFNLDDYLNKDEKSDV